MSDNKSIVQSIIAYFIKATFTAAIVLGLIIIGTFVFFSQVREVSPTTNNQNQYRVQGSASRKVKPDIARINLSADITGTDVRSVQQNASEAINKATDAVKTIGVKEDEIKTSNYNISPNYDYTAGNQKRLTGYTATVSVNIETKMIDKVAQILDKATAAGINSVNGLSFSVSNQKDIEKELKLTAIDNAKAEAKKISEKSGLRLGNLQNIEDSYNYPIMYNETATKAVNAADSRSSAPINLNVQPGENEITANVTLVYKLN